MIVSRKLVSASLIALLLAAPPVLAANGDSPAPMQNGSGDPSAAPAKRHHHKGDHKHAHKRHRQRDNGAPQNSAPGNPG